MENFIIFSSGYNAGPWIGKHMQSIEAQTHDNLLHVVIDDASTDNTWEEIVKHVHGRCVAHRNERNIGWTANAVRYLGNYINYSQQIIVQVDLDDWLIEDSVLSYLSEIYDRRKPWVTYGSLVRSNGEHRPNNDLGYEPLVIRNRGFRDAKWRFWAPRTFKAFMWLALEKRRLLSQDGSEYSRYTQDWAIGFPLLEMCPPDKLLHITKKLYVYNVGNPLSDKKVNRADQYALGMHFKEQGRVAEYVTKRQMSMQRFVIFSCGRNCEKWVAAHMQSIQKQTYKNYLHVIVDDDSEDGTHSAIQKLADDHTILLHNHKQQFWLYNSSWYLKDYVDSDNDVVVVVDLDDWLADDWILERLNNIYNREGCWMTYGSWAVPDDDSQPDKYRKKWGQGKIKPECKEPPKHILTERRFRETAAFSHLKTFKYFLFKNINPDDFKGPNGEWAPCCYDRALMYPMLEMTPTKKIRRIYDLLYYYNLSNSESWAFKDRDKQIFYEKWFCSKPSYKQLPDKG